MYDIFAMIHFNVSMVFAEEEAVRENIQETSVDIFTKTATTDLYRRLPVRKSEEAPSLH